jgi:hypothetical protein
MKLKFFVATVFMALSLMLVGCGANSSSNPANVNGTWNATLIDSNNVTAFSFGTSLVVNGDGSLSISKFTFNSNSGCFVSGETESGSFTLSGDFNGNTKGTFGFTVNSGTPAGNTLTLQGTANGNTISGQWTMSGTGCTGSGTFTMTKV